MATKRTGLPYIYVTWLAKLLGGQQCLWSAWFKSHFKYDKYEEQAMDLVKWNRDHTALMARRRKALEAEGWTVFVEDQNAFRLEGKTAVIAGKPDIVAVKDDQVLVVDGKTGRQRESDIWQVLFYLYALPKSRPDLVGVLCGEVEYKSGECLTVTPEELADRMSAIVDLIRIVSADTPPKRTPSRPECKVCNIGPRDCPARIGAETMTAVGDF